MGPQLVHPLATEKKCNRYSLTSLHIGYKFFSSHINSNCNRSNLLLAGNLTLRRSHTKDLTYNKTWTHITFHRTVLALSLANLFLKDLQFKEPDTLDAKIIQLGTPSSRRKKKRFTYILFSQSKACLPNPTSHLHVLEFNGQKLIPDKICRSWVGKSSWSTILNVFSLSNYLSKTLTFTCKRSKWLHHHWIYMFNTNQHFCNRV